MDDDWPGTDRGPERGQDDERTRRTGLIRVRVVRVVIVTDGDGRLLTIRLARPDDVEG